MLQRKRPRMFHTMLCNGVASSTGNAMFCIFFISYLQCIVLRAIPLAWGKVFP